MKRRNVVSENGERILLDDILSELGLELDGGRVGEEDRDFSRDGVVHDRVVLQESRAKDKTISVDGRRERGRRRKEETENEPCRPRPWAQSAFLEQSFETQGFQHQRRSRRVQWLGFRRKIPAPA